MSADRNAMLDAVATGDLERVRHLVEADPALARVRTAEGDSVLLLSVYHGHREIIEYLVERAAPLELHEAAASVQSARVIELLDAQPALISSYSHDGFTCLHLAAFFGHESLVEALLGRGAVLNAPAKHLSVAAGATPLHSAIAGNRPGVVAGLLRGGADVEARDASGFTPLVNAAFQGNVEVVRLLLDHGADRSRRDGAERTALSVAHRRGHAEVVRLLREHGATE